MLLDLVVVLDVVRVARVAIVTAAHFPGTGGLVVNDHVIAVAVAEVDHFVHVVCRLVVEHRATRAGAAGVRVPVEVGGEAPVAVIAILVFQGVRRDIGLRAVEGFWIDARQLNLAVLEVHGLADAEALTLEAVVFDPAVGHAQRQLVLIANAIGAAEAVVAEQRGIAEGVFAGVEYRDVFLVLLRHVQIEQAWLQGLAVVFAEPLGVAVEIQPAVDAENRYGAILCAVEVAQEVIRAGTVRCLLGRSDLLFARGVQAQVVTGVHILDRRLDETVGGFHRQAHDRRQVHPFAIGTGQAEDVGVIPRAGNAVLVYEVAGAQVPIELHELGFVAQGQAARIVRQGTIEGDLRQAVIGGDVGDVGQLIRLHIQARRVGVATIGQCALLVDVVLAFHADLVGFQILEVVRITDVGVIDFAHQALVQAALVLPVDHPALFFVVRHQFALVFLVIEVGAAELTFAAFGEVAELALHQQAALGHVAWI
ncbi:hypothetical protein D3C80_1087870 [compost metagenome]